MKWLKMVHDFGLPMVVLTLSARDAAMHRVKRVLNLADDDPGKLEEELTAVITDTRPELKGGSLVAMDMASLFHLRFYYYHPKLPRHMMPGSGLPEMPLVPPVNEPPCADVPALVARHRYDNDPSSPGYGQHMEAPVPDDAIVPKELQGSRET